MIMIMTTTMMMKYCNCYCCQKLQDHDELSSALNLFYSAICGKCRSKHKEVMDKSRKIYSLKKKKRKKNNFFRSKKHK